MYNILFPNSTLRMCGETVRKLKIGQSKPQNIATNNMNNKCSLGKSMKKQKRIMLYEWE